MSWDFVVLSKFGRVSDELISIWKERVYHAAGLRSYLYFSQVGLSYRPSVCRYLIDKAR